MTRHRLEVADVFRSYGPAYLEAMGRSVSAEQRRVLNAITNCRTAALGGHVKRCDRCEHKRIWYNSCRNRHCPKCRAAASANWLDERAAELLPVEYFHVVFTLPDAIRPVALQNKRLVYGMLFRAAAETLLKIAADPKHLGARIGFLAVLHTWGQNLLHHPHLHCVVPGGGLSPDGSQWIAAHRGYFLPVQVLSQVFRGKFLQLLERAFDQGKLCFHGTLQQLTAAAAFRRLLTDTRRKDWVVYAKRPFGGPELVLKYLARYTHRVAISNRRLVELSDGEVRFRWKDYRDANAQKLMRLDAREFIRRFLLHVLPQGFMRIRHYGLLSNRVQQTMLPLCRQLLGARQAPECTSQDVCLPRKSGQRDLFDDVCPSCKEGRLTVVELLQPLPSRHSGGGSIAFLPIVPNTS